MLAADEFQVRAEVGDDDGGQRDGPVLVTLARADGDLVAREVDILRAEAQGLEEAQPAAVEQDGDGGDGFQGGIR